MKKVILFFLISLSSYGAQQVPAIARKPLNEFIIYEVPVAELGNTTILFPSHISCISSSKASSSIQANAQFQIFFQPECYYLYIRALQPNSEDYMTVIYKNKAYIFHIFSSKRPYRALTLFQPSKTLSKGNKGFSPEMLLSLLDKAKIYSVLAAQHPESVEGVMHDEPKKEINYDNYRIIISDVYRFEEADTLIFRLSLENKTSKIITYNPQNVSIGLKENLYSTSIVDASGDIPPNSTVTAYVGITGTASGGRNNLSPKNDWNIILLADGQNRDVSESSKDDKKVIKKL